MAASTCGSHISPCKERTSQWIISQEIPADLIVRVGDVIFPLHKAMMVPNSGCIRRKVAANSDGAAIVEIDLSELPGGADAFEKAARFCYGVNFEISVHNVAALRCAAAHLDMAVDEHGGGLARRTEEFLAQAALRTLRGAVAVLRSCEGLLPAAEGLGIVQRCADAIALKICTEVLFPTQSPPKWWAAELAGLSLASFHRVLSALRSLRASPDVVATAAVTYAEVSLDDLLAGDATAAADPRRQALLESIVAVLPAGHEAPLPASFLCRLLRAAATSSASTGTRRHLERRVAAVLDQATAADLLVVALGLSGERVGDVDTVLRVVAGFVERETAETSGGGLLYGSGRAMCSAAMQKVASVLDAVAAEIATDEELPISKFVGVAGAVPKSARRFDDDLYRAVDIYLKAHPGLDEIEREKVCSVMDPLKLSYEARLHAAQNKRLPLQAVLSALYYDQLKLRGGSQHAADLSPAAAAAARGRTRTDVSLAQENDTLRSELARMRAHISELERGGGSNGSKPVGAPAPKKNKTFFGSVSRTLGRLNPFKSGSKDTSSIAETDGIAAVHVVKPKRRRFSIS